jgi:hypothetical protein
MTKIYQVHFITEVAPTIVSDDLDIHGTITPPQVIRAYKYVVANNGIDAKIKAYQSRNEEDEIYALEVGEETIKDEINHCKELIAYWNGQPKEKLFPNKEDSHNTNEIVKQSQKNKIKNLQKILKEYKGLKHD